MRESCANKKSIAKTVARTCSKSGARHLGVLQSLGGWITLWEMGCSCANAEVLQLSMPDAQIVIEKQLLHPELGVRDPLGVDDPRVIRDGFELRGSCANPTFCMPGRFGKKGQGGGGPGPFRDPCTPSKLNTLPVARTMGPSKLNTPPALLQKSSCATAWFFSF